MTIAPDTLRAWRALSDGLAARHAAAGRPLVVGLCGGQGSGKSTCAAFLVDHLASHHGLRAVVLSLDDFYLPRADRLDLAERVHPLFVTRGVPGSHDSLLGRAALDALRSGKVARWPAFDKARDERHPTDADHHLSSPVDLVLFEGWCVGLPPERDEALAAPVNALERDEDADGRWRRAVNAHLAGDYADWFSRLDVRVFLAVPDMAAVHRWRGEQEADTARHAGPDPSALLTPESLTRFIAHYERLTRHALRVMPELADAVLRLDDQHAVRALHWR